MSEVQREGARNMKRFLSGIALCGLLLCPAGVLAQQPKTIYDPRLDLKPAVLSPVEEALMKEKVLPAAGKEWHDQELAGKCEAGKAPGVIDVARGSFTKPGSDQKAILYRYCETGHNMALNGIAIVEKGAVVCHLVYPGEWDNGVGALPDINGDGRSELLISSGGTNQGITWGSIRIIELSDTIVLTKFGGTRTLSDNRGADEKNGRATAYRISVKSGPMADFYHELFVNKGACSGTGVWKKSGKREKISLENDTTDYQFIR
jgi:hypothetical protein